MKLEEFQRIIKKLQQGDKAAVEQLYCEYFDKIYSLAISEVRNESDPYDIAMTVIMKLIDYQGDADKIQNHVGFMVTMTKNATKDLFRSKEYNTLHNSDWSFTKSVKGDSLWFFDILNVLTKNEIELFFDHIIWEKSLKEIAKGNNESYISVRRKYKEIKTKIMKLYE